MSETLKNVVRAVVVPAKKLAMTLVLALFVFYSYSLVAFFYLRPSYRNDEDGVNRCNTLLFCFLTHIDLGLKDSIGDAMVAESPPQSPTYGARLVFEISFVIIVTIALVSAPCHAVPCRAVPCQGLVAAVVSPAGCWCRRC